MVRSRPLRAPVHVSLSWFFNIQDETLFGVSLPETTERLDLRGTLNVFKLKTFLHLSLMPVNMEHI